jgi:hypothetical protein
MMTAFVYLRIRVDMVMNFRVPSDARNVLQSYVWYGERRSANLSFNIVDSHNTRIALTSI